MGISGMVIIQKTTHLVVILHDMQKKDWFFPQGRKNIGKSFEHMAIREAYEEVSIIWV